MPVQWVPGDHLEDIIEHITQNLVAVYTRHEEQLLYFLARQLNVAETPLDAHTIEQRMINTTEETARVRRLAETLQDDATGAALEMVETASQYGIATALSQLADQGLPGRDYPTTTPAVYAILGDLGNALDEAHRRVLRVPDDMYRQVNAIGSAQGVVAGLPLKSRHYRIWNDFVNRGIRGFTDVSGRNWNLASYVEMASRTTVARAYRAQHEHTLLENGVSLATIVVESNACPDCASWGGKIISLDGSPAGQYPVWSPMTGQDVTVTVHGTREDASAGGVFHPNCMCTQTPFIPGTRPPRAARYDKGEHKAREAQRYHEREIRRLKREIIVDPDFESDYQTKIAGHQARIRELVETHDLNRKREREQPHHGYKPTKT